VTAVDRGAIKEVPAPVFGRRCTVAADLDPGHAEVVLLKSLDAIAHVGRMVSDFRGKRFAHG